MTLQHASIEELAEVLKERFLDKLFREFPRENAATSVIIHNLNITIHFPDKE